MPDFGMYPKIAITKPGAGATVSYSTKKADIDVAFTVDNIMLSDAGKCPYGRYCAHVQLFVDGMICNDLSNPSNKWNAEASASPTTVGLDYCPTFPNLGPRHTLRVELHDDSEFAYFGSDGKVIADQIDFSTTRVPDPDGGTP